MNFIDIFAKYIRPPITTEDGMNTWSNNPIQSWQNQLNFAVWCTTVGCGVSFNDHFNNEYKFIRSLYKFHIYYTVRRIFYVMKFPLPQDATGSALNNMIDEREYKRI